MLLCWRWPHVACFVGQIVASGDNAAVSHNHTPASHTGCRHECHRKLKRIIQSCPPALHQRTQQAPPAAAEPSRPVSEQVAFKCSIQFLCKSCCAVQASAVHAWRLSSLASFSASSMCPCCSGVQSVVSNIMNSGSATSASPMVLVARNSPLEPTPRVAITRHLTCNLTTPSR